MAKRPSRAKVKLVDAFESRSAAVAAARDLNALPDHPNCPGGPRARARPLREGRLKWGVFVRKTCRIY